MADGSLGAQESAFLVFTPQELEIAVAAREVLEGVLPVERLHHTSGSDLSEPNRRQLHSLGWFSLLAPEELGGGLSSVELSLFFREVGRVCAPIDLVAHVLATTFQIEDGHGHSLADADEAIGLCFDDPSGLRIAGTPSRVALHVTPAGVSLVEVGEEAVKQPPSLDPGTTLRVLPKARLAGTKMVVEGPAPWRLGQLAVASMLVGIAEATLELIVEYAKVRETFGRKIGSYQAVRHPCAEMALRLEAARSQLWYAAAALKEDRSDAEAHLDGAKHLANEAAISNADTCIQLHGGIGVTDEHNAHLFLKRALLLSQAFGTRRQLLGRLLTAVLAD